MLLVGVETLLADAVMLLVGVETLLADAAMLQVDAAMPQVGVAMPLVDAAMLLADAAMPLVAAAMLLVDAAMPLVAVAMLLADADRTRKSIFRNLDRKVKGLLLKGSSPFSLVERPVYFSYRNPREGEVTQFQIFPSDLRGIFLQLPDL